MKVYWGIGGISPYILDLNTRWRYVVLKNAFFVSMSGVEWTSLAASLIWIQSCITLSFVSVK